MLVDHLCKKELKLNPYASALTELKINSTDLQVLNNLSSHPLPESVSYVSLIGTGVTNDFVFNEDGDGIVTATSQNLRALVASPKNHNSRNIPIKFRADPDCGHNIPIPTITNPFNKFQETHTCEAGDPDVWTAILSALHKTSVNPQGKTDTVGNKNTPTAKPKVKKVTRTECNKSSSVTSTSTGGAQGALNKFGTSTDGCSQ
jgi:hypothetical protein